MNKILAAVNAITGVVAFSVEISGLAIYSNWIPDYIAVGIWGGIYLLAFAFLLITKKLKSTEIVRRTAELAALIGVTMIGLYSWSINSYQPLIADCEMYTSVNSTLSDDSTIGEMYPDIFTPLKMCGRVAIDSLMIICGIVVVIASVFIDVMASFIASD